MKADGVYARLQVGHEGSRSPKPERELSLSDADGPASVADKLPYLLVERFLTSDAGLHRRHGSLYVTGRDLPLPGLTALLKGSSSF